MATSAQQKQELFKAIWATAEDLRNSVDGWDFKSYVLGILFYRFISENITNYVNRLQAEAGFEGFDYADFSDEDIDNIYAAAESDETNKRFVAENSKENLAQVFAEVRYPRANNEAFSQKVAKWIKEQGF